MIKSFSDAQRAVRRLRTKLSAPGSPVRHLRRAAAKTLHPVRTRERAQAGKRLMSKLSPELAATVEELRREGTAPFNAHLDPALLAELDAYYKNVLLPRAEKTESFKTHPFFFQLSGVEDQTLDNIMSRFALQESVLAAAAAYLGTAPFFQMVRVIESRGISQTKWEASQLWHLDYADSRAVWLWVYLTDVNDVADGPYTYLPVEASKHVNNSFFPRRIMDEEIDNSPLKSQVRQVMGPRLTSFLVDSTSIYHMGSRLADGHKRCIYSASFIDPVFHQTAITASGPIDGDQRLLLNL